MSEIIDADDYSRDRRRRPLLDDYFRLRVFGLMWPVSGRRVTFGEYADRVLDGTWNATVREHWPTYKGLLTPERSAPPPAPDP